MNKESDYQCKILTLKDVSKIMPLLIDSFTNHNQSFKALGLSMTDSQQLFSLINWEVIFNQKLSYGCFLNEQLVSLSIMSDYKIPYRTMTEEVQNNKNLQTYFKWLDKLNGDFKIKEQNTPKGELVYLFFVATEKEHVKKNLAEICIINGVMKAKEFGFKRLVTESSHIATQKLMNRLFKNKLEIIKEIYIKDAQRQLTLAKL